MDNKNKLEKAIEELNELMKECGENMTEEYVDTEDESSDLELYWEASDFYPVKYFLSELICLNSLF